MWTHSIHQVQTRIVWSTKYRYGVLRGDIQVRCRDLLRQSCHALDIQILKGVVSKGNIHLHVSYPRKVNCERYGEALKGRSAKLLLSEYVELKRDLIVS